MGNLMKKSNYHALESKNNYETSIKLYQ